MPINKKVISPDIVEAEKALIKKIKEDPEFLTKDPFLILQEFDVTPYLDKKGQFDYLNWASAWRLLNTLFPDAHHDIHRNNHAPVYLVAKPVNAIPNKMVAAL